MFELAIQGPRLTRVVALGDGMLVIGRGIHCDVRLPHNSVSRQHARLVARASSLVIADLANERGTQVNGRKLAGPQALRRGDRIGIGVFELELRAAVDPAQPFAPADAIEAGLVDRVAAGDADSRAIYADWLDDHGQPARAQLLRAPTAITAAEHATPGDHRWRLRVTQPPIERCGVGVAFDVECPLTWQQLQPTAHDDVRSCAACEKPVYYCDSVMDARHHAAAGHCVALDLTAARKAGDLDGEWRTCPACNYKGNARWDDTCDHCGGTLPSLMMRLGKVALPVHDD